MGVLTKNEAMGYLLYSFYHSGAIKGSNSRRLALKLDRLIEEKRELTTSEVLNIGLNAGKEVGMSETEELDLNDSFYIALERNSNEDARSYLRAFKIILKL